MLILTRKDSELFLWACSPDLHLTLLLKKTDDGGECFFNIIQVRNGELALVFHSGYEGFNVYEMPEVQKESGETTD